MTALCTFKVTAIFLYLLPSVPANNVSWCQQLTISWVEKPPYVITLPAAQSSDQIQLGGAFRYPLEEVFTKCCAHVQTKKTPFAQFRKVNSDKELLRLLGRNETHIALPFVGSPFGIDEEQDGYRFVAVFDHPGTEYYTKPEINEPTEVLLEIIWSSWPLFAFTFSLTAIAGIIIWATDTFWNANEFPRSFLRGSWEGLWWSYISMTTVGYGDKAPKSILARILAIAWIQIGLVVSAIFMANVTTALTSMPYEKEYGELKVNTTVAVLRNDTAAVQHVIKLQAQPKDYREFREIANSLHKKDVAGFMMDRYEAGHYFREYRNLSQNLTGMLRNNDPLSMGMLIGKGPGTEWPALCLKRHVIELHQSAIAMQDTLNKMLHRGQRKTKTFNLFSSENVTTLKRCTIYISLTLGAMIAVGLVWEVLYYCNKGIRRLSTWKNTVGAVRMTDQAARQEISEIKQTLTQLQTSIEKLEARLVQTTDISQKRSHFFKITNTKL